MNQIPIMYMGTPSMNMGAPIMPIPMTPPLMSCPLQKHRRFVSEPIGYKDVTALPGIGPVLGGRLKQWGIYLAEQVLGLFLYIRRDPGMFAGWLTSHCGANLGHCRSCYYTLNEYCNYMHYNCSLQKHRGFVSEPIGHKDVTALPGIGPVLGGRLKQRGIYLAEQVLGWFLYIRRDPGMFAGWLTSHCGANLGHCNSCYYTLNEYNYCNCMHYNSPKSPRIRG